MKHEVHAFLFGGFMTVTGLVLGAFLDLSPRDAIEIGAFAMAVALAGALPALRACASDEEDDR